MEIKDYTPFYDELSRALLEKLAQRNAGKNVVLSPLSILMLLGICAASSGKKIPLRWHCSTFGGGTLSVFYRNCSPTLSVAGGRASKGTSAGGRLFPWVNTNRVPCGEGKK